MNIFDDDCMTGSPKENYFSIAKTASQNIVNMMIDEDADRRVDSIFIELMGNIITQCE